MNSDRSGVSFSTDFFVAVLIGLVFLFVWPGPLRYEYSYRKSGLVRIDRISKNAQILIDGEFKRVTSIDDGGVNWVKEKK